MLRVSEVALALPQQAQQHAGLHAQVWNSDDWLNMLNLFQYEILFL